MAARAKRIKVDLLDSTRMIVDQSGDSWLDKPVSEWLEGVIFPVNRGIYAKTMMVMGEAKVARKEIFTKIFKNIAGNIRFLF